MEKNGIDWFGQQRRHQQPSRPSGCSSNHSGGGAGETVATIQAGGGKWAVTIRRVGAAKEAVAGIQVEATKEIAGAI